MKQQNKEILVYADWDFLPEIKQMGTLYSNITKGSEIFSFEYEKKWLESGNAQIIDPDLSFFEGRQYLNDTENKKNFGMFLDSSPDRWGRKLMQKREAVLAKEENRPVRVLLQSDYLLGVYDKQRMGGLRFKIEPEGEYLNNNSDKPIPHWTSIRELEDISKRLESDDAINDPDYVNWLNMIFAPGSSLGGARPKASVVDTNGLLWIAKLPKQNDSFNYGAWENVINELAILSEINIAEGFAKKYGSKHHSYLTKRFDRTITGRRKHFASAMTLLGYYDDQDNKGAVSYLELVDFITTHGANVNNDLEELWRRIVFNICVSNTDDHLRNHGFLLTSDGWVLSPAYDINPIEDGTALQLNITENDNSLNLDLALEVREYFRLSETQATEIVKKVKTSVNLWKQFADKYDIPKSEQELKSIAFSRAL